MGKPLYAQKNSSRTTSTLSSEFRTFSAIPESGEVIGSLHCASRRATRGKNRTMVFNGSIGIASSLGWSDDEVFETYNLRRELSSRERERPRKNGNAE